jgi:signal transduction histidine kinase
VRRFFDDLLYLLCGLPLALVSFTVLVTLLSASVGLIVVWVGVPLLVFTLYLARGFAIVERGRLRIRGEELAPAVYAESAPGATWWRRTIDRLSDRQHWLDTVHGLLVFPLATVTWSIAVTWVTTTAGGLTAYAWVRHMPDRDHPDNTTLIELLKLDHGGDLAEAIGWHPSEELLFTLIGIIGLLTVVPVIRALAIPQAGLARTLLANDRVAELQAKVEAMRATQEAAADAVLTDHQRLERDIHDGPQQRLVRLGMDLAAIERRMERDPEAARQMLGEARQHANAALEELRLLSRGIAPPLLTDRGLGPALVDLGTRSVVPVTVDLQLPPGERLPTRVETALYFTDAEALTNVAKHAEATQAAITVTRDRTAARLTLTDDGRGGADLAKGHGLVGLRDRLALVDGMLHVDSPVGGPTTITAEVPCGS